MSIQLDDNYRIESEAASWNLIYEKTGDINPKTGRPKMTRDASYHANLRQALIKYLDDSLKGSQTLAEVLARLSEVEATIKTIKAI